MSEAFSPQAVLRLLTGEPTPAPLPEEGGEAAPVCWQVAAAGVGEWLVDPGPPVRARPGEPGARVAARAVLALTWDDLQALARGELEPRQAFLDGRLRISGDWGLAQAAWSLVAPAP